MYSQPSYQEPTPTLDRAAPEQPTISCRSLWTLDKTLKALISRDSAEKEKGRVAYDLTFWRRLGAPQVSSAYRQALEVTAAMRELIP